jgi:hypothetical protein
MALYHSDVYMPQGLKLPSGTMLLEYGSHARREAMSDRYGHIKLPTSIKFEDYKVIEVEVINGKVQKVLYRGKLDEKRDLCIVIMPAKRFVKTVWVNLNNDKHRTLDASKYDKE